MVLASFSLLSCSCLLCCTISHLEPVPELDYLVFCAFPKLTPLSPLPAELQQGSTALPVGSAEGSGLGRHTELSKHPLPEPCPALGKGNVGLRLLAWTWSRNPLPAMKVCGVKDPQGSELPPQPGWDCWLLAGNLDSLFAVESASDV